MTSDQKEADLSATPGERVEALVRLCERAWLQFNERRKYEIQVTLSIWTAIALATAALVNLDNLPSAPWLWKAVLAVAVLVVFLHSQWCRGIWQSNRRDRDRAIAYQDEINVRCGMDYPNKLKSAFSGTNQASPWQDWNYRFQIAVTVFLAACFFGVGYLKSGPQALDALRANEQAQDTRDSLAIRRQTLELYLLGRDSGAAHAAVGPPASVQRSRRQ